MMENKLKQLRKSMDSTTHKGVHFTEFHKNKIRNAVHTQYNVKPNKPNKFVVIIFSTLTICLLTFFISTELLMTQSNNGKTIGDSSDLTNTEEGNESNHEEKEDKTDSNTDWSDKHNVEVRYEFNRDWKEVFSVFADPALKAGDPYGYIFSFQEPFDVFEGKELAITAVNQENGERVQALYPLKITEPSSGYSSLQRFMTTFEIPYGGVWKYEVYLDGDGYGEVVVDVADEENPFEKLFTRIDIQEAGEKVVITDKEILEKLKNTMEQVKWDNTKQVSWVRYEDIKATIYIQSDENKPETSFVYWFWFNEDQETASILSTNLKENVGTLDVENTKVLKKILLGE